MSDEDIVAVSQHKFNNVVKNKANEFMIKYIVTLQIQATGCRRYVNLPMYLLDTRFSKKEREVLFKLISKTIQTKENLLNPLGYGTSRLWNPLGYGSSR